GENSGWASGAGIGHLCFPLLVAVAVAVAVQRVVMWHDNQSSRPVNPTRSVLSSCLGWREVPRALPVRDVAEERLLLVPGEDGEGLHEHLSEDLLAEHARLEGVDRS